MDGRDKPGHDGSLAARLAPLSRARKFAIAAPRRQRQPLIESLVIYVLLISLILFFVKPFGN